MVAERSSAESTEGATDASNTEVLVAMMQQIEATFQGHERSQVDTRPLRRPNTFDGVTVR